MSHQIPTDKSEEQGESPAIPKRHPITLENSPEETIRRMRSFPERADKLRENISKGKERRTSSRTQLIIAAMLLLSVLMVGSRDQSSSTLQLRDNAVLDQDRAIVMKITPVGFSRKSVDYVEKLQFKVGESIRIALFMTNTTSETIVTSTVSELFYYRPQLLKDGQLVGYRKEIIPNLVSYDEYRSAAVYRCIMIVLAPHKPEGVDYIDLNYWYGSLDPGHYQLTFGWPFWYGAAQIQSNTVTFDVIPAKRQN